jgi:hypothetical protein
MAITADTIDHTTLARLVEAGAVRGADVIGHGSGWGVVVKYGMTERALAARRGAVRTFRKFETLVSYLKEIGISQYNVNAADFDPQAIKTSRVRPDASERRRTPIGCARRWPNRWPTHGPTSRTVKLWTRCKP